MAAATSKEAFPEKHWPRLRELMAAGGPDAVIGFIEEQEEDAKRLALFQLAQRGFGERVPDLELDDLVDIVEAGIDEALRQAETARDAGDEKRADALTDAANVLSYNLSAALADCWPGDARARERRHFELGLEAAELCLGWREELRKGPLPFSMAWWAKGMHLLSLARHDEAANAFEESLRHAFAHAAAHGASANVDATGDRSVLLAAGYLEIARTRQGRPRTALDRVLAALDEAAEKRPHDRDDLAFAASQLREVLHRQP
jgi:hypothetical protein